MTTESPSHTDREHSEGTREDSNSEESMDDDNEPVPENDDEPSSEAVMSLQMMGQKQ